MFRGNRTPEDLTYIDSTDNDTVRAVKSAWNLNRYGTSWSELLKAVEKAKKDEFVDDSLQYLVNQEEDLWMYDDDDNPYARDEYMYEDYLVPSENGPYYLNGERLWPGTERTYFNYLDSISEHPLENDQPINERAKAYQHWKKLKYGK